MQSACTSMHGVEATQVNKHTGRSGLSLVAGAAQSERVPSCIVVDKTATHTPPPQPGQAAICAKLVVRWPRAFLPQCCNFSFRRPFSFLVICSRGQRMCCTRSGVRARPDLCHHQRPPCPFLSGDPCWWAGIVDVALVVFLDPGRR